MQHIDQNFINDYLKKFRVFESDITYEPDWELIKSNRCPICCCKLKKPLYKEILYCRSKKHTKPFIITSKRYNEIINDIFIK